MNSHPLSDAWQLFTNQLLELNSFEFSTMSDYDIGNEATSSSNDWTRSAVDLRMFLINHFSSRCRHASQAQHIASAAAPAHIKEQPVIRSSITHRSCLNWEIKRQLHHSSRSVITMYEPYKGLGRVFFGRWASSRTRDNWPTCRRRKRVKRFSCFRNNRSRKFVFFCWEHITRPIALSTFTRFVPFVRENYFEH